MGKSERLTGGSVWKGVFSRFMKRGEGGMGGQWVAYLWKEFVL